MNNKPSQYRKTTNQTKTTLQNTSPQTNKTDIHNQNNTNNYLENINFLFEKGKHLLDKFDSEQSIKYFDKCLEINPQLAFVWMYKSIALSDIGHDIESDKCFKTAIKLDSNTITVFDDVLVIDE
ncbi:MAG: hypothetical protein E7Z80_02945 [Methanobrevibacter thaueri]|nr:hypothetical protein [Methanobrevibacter thaueri]